MTVWRGGTRLINGPATTRLTVHWSSAVRNLIGDQLILGGRQAHHNRLAPCLLIATADFLIPR